MNPTGEQLLRRVAAALTQVRDPAGEDVVSTGRVRDLQALEDGTVRFRFALQGEDPGTLVRAARGAAEAVEGVNRVKIDVTLPAAFSSSPTMTAKRAPLLPAAFIWDFMERPSKARSTRRPARRRSRVTPRC